ncbi:MAG: hypothetical protein AAGA54_01920 [Myxococcota bacterium]
MFHATLAVTLPEALPEPTPAVERLVGLVLSRDEEAEPNEADLRLEALLRANLAVYEAMLRAFEAAGFDDVVAVVVDGKPAYVDTEETIGDLQQALEGVVKSQAVAEGFSVMRTTFVRREGALKILAELRTHAVRPDHSAETRVRISARPMDFDPTDDEGPKEYAARVRGYVDDVEAVEAQRSLVEGVVAKLAAEIPGTLAGTTATGEPTIVRFVAPGARQLGRMRHLGFGSALRRTVYCSLPSYERIGPYDDPLARHYYSPYSDLFHWLAVGEVLAGKLPTHQVEVVSATGALLFRGDRHASFDPARFSVPRDVVRVSPQGRLKIDASVPEVANLDPAEAGSPHVAGWAGEQWAEDIDG